MKKELGRKHVIEEQNGHGRKCKGKMEDKQKGEKRIGKEAWDRQGIEWRCEGLGNCN